MESMMIQLAKQTPTLWRLSRMPESLEEEIQNLKDWILHYEDEIYQLQEKIKELVKYES